MPHPLYYNGIHCQGCGDDFSNVVEYESHTCAPAGGRR